MVQWPAVMSAATQDRKWRTERPVCVSWWCDKHLTRRPPPWLHHSVSGLMSCDRPVFKREALSLAAGDLRACLWLAVSLCRPVSETWSVPNTSLKCLPLAHRVPLFLCSPCDTLLWFQRKVEEQQVALRCHTAPLKHQRKLAAWAPLSLSVRLNPARPRLRLLLVHVC